MMRIKKNIILWMKTIQYQNKIRSHLVTIAPMAPFAPKPTSKLRSALSALHFRNSIVILRFISRAIGNILFINLYINTLVLCKTILHNSSNLSFRKIRAVWAKKAEKVIILTIFFCTKNSGLKSLSPA